MSVYVQDLKCAVCRSPCVAMAAEIACGACSARLLCGDSVEARTARPHNGAASHTFIAMPDVTAREASVGRDRQTELGDG